RAAGGLVAVLEWSRGGEVVVSDWLPDVAGSESLYAFARAGDSGPGDAAAEAVVLQRIAALHWVQLPSVGVNQETGSVTWRRAPGVAVTTASGLASVAMAQYIAAPILFH